MIDVNDKYDDSKTAISSLYYRFPGSIFTKDKSTFQIKDIYPGKNDDKGIKILNKPRLEHRLKKLIATSYKRRIEAHDMNRTPLSSSMDLELREYTLNRSGNTTYRSGYYSLFPLEFICKKCKKIIKLEERDLPGFNGICECSGNYEQNTIILFCESCGALRRLTDAHYCSTHKNKNVKVNYANKTSLRTWSIECIDCTNERKASDAKDVFSITCHHKNYGKLESNADATKMKPLTVRDGGIVGPVNVKTVDFETNIKDAETQNYIMLAIKENILTKENLINLLPYSGPTFENTMGVVKEIVHQSASEYGKSLFTDAIAFLEDAIERVKKQYEGLDVDAICDLMYLKQDAKSKKYSDFLIELEPRNNLFSREYEALRERYHISEITYIDNIRLVSSTYGRVYGPVKHYDSSYVPHFEPFWVDNRNKTAVYSLSYPFQTEGIMIELDPSAIIQWLESNRVCTIDNNDRANPGLFLNKMNISSPEYTYVKGLIHTISHILIKKSVLYTGLDEDSYGELLFPSNYSLIVYSTSTVNIGGIDYLFKYHLPNWFSDLDTDSCDCVFDPACLGEVGACFNCLFLPEYVCSDFNTALSRNYLLGGGKNNLYGFWRSASE